MGVGHQPGTHDQLCDNHRAEDLIGHRQTLKKTKVCIYYCLKRTTPAKLQARSSIFTTVQQYKQCSPLYRQAHLAPSDQSGAVTVSVRRSIRDDLDSCSCQLPSFSVSDGTQLARLESVTDNMIRKLISGSPTKSCVLDPVPTLLMKCFLGDLVPVVTRLANCSVIWNGPLSV